MNAAKMVTVSFLAVLLIIPTATATPIIRDGTIQAVNPDWLQTSVFKAVSTTSNVRITAEQGRKESNKQSVDALDTPDALDTERDTGSELQFTSVPVTEHSENRDFIVSRPSEDTLRIEAHMGRQETTGHDIRITDIIRKGNVIDVRVVLDHPSPDRNPAQQPVHPQHAVTVTVPETHEVYDVNIHVSEKNSYRVS